MDVSGCEKLPSDVTALSAADGVRRFLLSIPAGAILQRVDGRLREIAEQLGAPASPGGVPDAVRQRFRPGVLSEILDNAIREAAEAVGTDEGNRVVVEEMEFDEEKGLRCRWRFVAPAPSARHPDREAAPKAGKCATGAWVSLPPGESARIGDVVECAIEAWIETEGTAEGEPDLLGPATAPTGALPTGWWQVTPPSVTWTVTGHGTDFGLPYVELHYRGVAQARTQIALRFAQPGALSSDAPRLWLEARWRLSAGIMPANCDTMLTMGRYTKTGQYLDTLTASVERPSSKPIVAQPLAAGFDGKPDGSLAPGVAFWFSDEARVDFRLRLGGLSLRKAATLKLPWPEETRPSARLLLRPETLPPGLLAALQGMCSNETRIVRTPLGTGETGAKVTAVTALHLLRPAARQGRCSGQTGSGSREPRSEGDMEVTEGVAEQPAWKRYGEAKRKLQRPGVRFCAPAGGLGLLGPDFICIGAAKTGTSWLYEFLRRHPFVWLPPIKEISYFTSHYVAGSKEYFRPKRQQQLEFARRYWSDGATPHWRPQWDRDELDVMQAAIDHLAKDELTDGWYQEIFRFRDPDQACGDISPDYALMPRAGVRHVLALNPHVRIIVLLRDPIERYVSHGAMTLPRDHSVQALRDLLYSNTAENWRVVSDYGFWLPRWLTAFDSSRIHIEFNEDIGTDPFGVLKRICNFIGVPFEKDLFIGASQKVFEGTKPEGVNELMRDLRRDFARLYDNLSNLPAHIAERYR